MSAPDAGAPAILLDLDGTLIDTVEVWHTAYVRLAAELGLRAPDDLWPQVAGRNMQASLDVFGSAIAGADRDVLVHRLVALAADHLANPPSVDAPGWRWLAGARELLTLLRSARTPTDHGSVEGSPPVAVALVTSAWRAFTLPLLHRALDGPDVVAATFDAIVCGDEVRHGKPAPDSYLRAAELLGRSPAQCLVIEDSPTGVAAADAAGMVSLVVPHAGPVPAHPGRSIRGDLTGLTLCALTTLHTGLRSATERAEQRST